MPTINYCDYINGDDTNGTGAWDAPYKTITKASTGLTGGDEVRVAKSPGPTALTGTLSFTNGSKDVTGSGTAFTTELAIGDFVLGGDGNWWEVVTITSDTAATLYKNYSGTTQSGVASQKLGVTDTGAAASSATQVQVVSSSGTSSANLKISGGWDLSSETQTGQTFFRQLNTTTFTNRFGSGLDSNGKSYTEISCLHFLRYYIGINNNGNANIIHNPICNSNDYSGIVCISCHHNIIISPICNSNATNGILFDRSSGNVLVSPNCNSNVTNGIVGYMSNNNVLISPTVKFNNTGIANSASSNNFIYGTLTTEENVKAITNDIGTIYISKASIGESTKVTGFTSYANSRLYINDIGGNSQIWTDYANAVKQDATAGGTGKEWKLSITGANRTADYPFSVEVAAVPVNANKQVTVRLYFKKSGTGIAGRLFIRGGQIAGVDNDIYTECPDDTNRNQVTLQFTPTEKGVVEIEVQAWYVSSTSQNIIVDDIDISQAD